MVTITGTQALNGIKASPGVVESRTTAQAYYAAIDPNNQRTNLDDWLNDNCMQRELAGAPGYYGSDIHSTYLNDRDLGFGREMYFKTDCTTAQRTATGATINTAGGERASIVFNYSSLEGAIKRSGSFLAVAMEYRADASGGPKYTRFYTFAPDPRTREWKRVTSANFDGRRERYTPGNCTVCHGGKPKASYTGHARRRRPGRHVHPLGPERAAVRRHRPRPSSTSGSSRASPAPSSCPNIHLLNQFGVAPIVDSRIAETQPTGETLACWNAVRVLPGWRRRRCRLRRGSAPRCSITCPRAGRASTSPGSDRTAVRRRSTARSSRRTAACATCSASRMLARARLTTSTAPSSMPTRTPVRRRQRHQDRGCAVFEQHVMPGSRLTADRFWIQQPGDTLSAAKVLADHLDIDAPADVPAVAALAAAAG